MGKGKSIIKTMDNVMKKGKEEGRKGVKYRRELTIEGNGERSEGHQKGLRRMGRRMGGWERN